MMTPETRRRLVLLLPPAVALVLMLVAANLMVNRPREATNDPRPLGTVPAFSLTSQDARPFGSTDLAGRPYVASFFFTSCTTVCPKLMGNVAALQARFAEAGLDVRLLSVTVDPETDTPEVLRAYGERHGADFRRWTFVTGTPEELKRVIEGGFLTAMGEKQPDGRGGVDIGHGTKLMLVDADGLIVGQFETTPAGLDALFDAASRLAGRPVSAR